jgi:hypothetical protein
MRRASAASLLLVALLVAACGSSTTPGATASPAASSAAPSAVASKPVASPAVTPEATAESQAPQSEAPTASAKPVATPSPSATATEAPSPSDTATPSDSASPSPSASAAAIACSPEGNNPNFWPGIASSVSWDVYCAVLPKGWHVDGGTYRLANGGWLAITYKGPSGAMIALCEGGPFPSNVPCAISGSDSGDASFGGQAGTLITTDAGGFAIAVDRGQKPTWLMITSGLDQATTLALGAALAPIH